MSTIKEICKKIKQELNIMTSDEKPVPEPLLKTEDIVPEHTWIKSGVTCLALSSQCGEKCIGNRFYTRCGFTGEKKGCCIFTGAELTTIRLSYAKENQRYLRRTAYGG